MQFKNFFKQTPLRPGPLSQTLVYTLGSQGDQILTREFDFRVGNVKGYTSPLKLTDLSKKYFR